MVSIRISFFQSFVGAVFLILFKSDLISSTNSRFPSIVTVNDTFSSEQFKEAVNKAKDGQVSVMTFHGVPDVKHPWVNTDPDKFRAYMDYLKQSGCKVVALRDLKK